ncbi:MAG: lipase [Proteobacteria bacterium]|nr:MAG: lipase [Pseudomonadota bacterium]
MTAHPLREEVFAKIAALGARFDGDVMAATRAVIETLPDDAGDARRFVESVSYGPDPRHEIDVYSPGGTGRPVLVYVPGGGFVGGDKATYRRLGEYFARQGYLTLIGNYRLAPAVQWPSGAQDVSAMVDWAVANAARYGGDPARTFVFGQSAGATHVAGALFDPDLRPRNVSAVKAAVLASGIYRIEPTDPESGITKYFSDDASTYAKRSPLTHVGASRLPLLLLVAEYDPSFLGMPTLELAGAVYARDGKCPPLLWLNRHNHVSYVLGMGSAIDAVGPEIVRFFEAA